jgi:transcriptional regulator with XRE-family HTH domain
MMNESQRVQRIYERAGRELRVWRESLGWSQSQLGDQLGLKTRSGYEKLENGKVKLSLHQYLIVVDFLREAIPADHPALELANQLLNRKARLQR